MDQGVRHLHLAGGSDQSSGTGPAGARSLRRRSDAAGRWSKAGQLYPLELWGAYPVEVEEGVITPEEVLRRQMRHMGAEGERYDYVQFEGNARLLPRRTRATLAHLRVALGHLSNDRLHRMVSLAGGGSDLLEGIRNMRCQVCNMVRPPGSRPQVSYTKPTNF